MSTPSARGDAVELLVHVFECHGRSCITPVDDRSKERRGSSRAKLVTKGDPQAPPRSLAADPARVRSILEGLEELYPDVDASSTRDALQLVCATILSPSAPTIASTW